MILVVSRGYDAVYGVRPEHKYDRNFQQRFEMYQRLSRDPEMINISISGSLSETLDYVKRVLAP